MDGWCFDDLFGTCELPTASLDDMLTRLDYPMLDYPAPMSEADKSAPWQATDTPFDDREEDRLSPEIRYGDATLDEWTDYSPVFHVVESGLKPVTSRHDVAYHSDRPPSVGLAHPWEQMLNLLEEFVCANQRLPAFDTVYKTVSLGRWCDKNRQKFRKGSLSQKKIDQLNSIDRWQWAQRARSWQSNFDLLREYIDVAKKPPSQNTIYKSTKLGKWCVNQRANFRNGVIKQEQIDQLNSIDGWWWEPPADSWQSNFDLLREYVGAHKKQPGRDTTFKTVKLGNWCNNQRHDFRRGMLGPERTAQLNSIEIWKWWLR